MFATRARALLLLVLLAPLAPAAAPAPPTDAERAERGLAFVAARQGPDGTWSLTSQGYALEAAAGVGVDPKRWPTPERSAFAAQRVEACAYKTLPADREDCAYKSLLRVVHGVGATGYDPVDVNGLKAVEQVRAGFVAGQFGQPQYVNDDMWAILALRAAGAPASDPQVRAAAANVRAAQLDDGGWSYAPIGTRSSIDMTGLALAALRAAGDDATTNHAARAYVAAAYDAARKGFRTPGESVNCQATVWGVHAARLVGEPREEALETLRGIQNVDGGFAITLGGPSDLFCTVEAVPLLAGARLPMPAYAPATVEQSPAPAGEPFGLHVRGPFTDATWQVPGGTLRGTSVAWTPPAAGTYAFTVLAEGPGTRHRASGTMTVASRPPVVALAADAFTVDRGEAVVLDASGSHDPDGRVLTVEVAWGDGNVTRRPLAPVEHAYPRPGEYAARVRVMDDAGAWSAAAEALVVVRNRAPRLLDLPERVPADRVTDVTLAPRAWDAEGDALRVAWRAGDAAGEGNATLRFAALGEHVVAFRVEDAFGAWSAANVTVLVRNLPPRLAHVSVPPAARPGEPFPLAADATDPDGPAPTVTWRVGNATLHGSHVNASLPAGTHEVVVEAVDADGAVAREVRALVVAAEDAPPAPPPPVAEPEPEPVVQDAPLPEPLAAPEFDAPPALARPGAPVRFVLVPVRDAVEYRYDFGDGARTPWTTDTVASHAYAAEGEYVVEATARAADGRASAARVALRVVAPPAPARAAPPPAEPEAAPPAEAAPEPVEAASLVRQDPARREAPLPWGLALAGLLLAARGTRARRG